MIKNVFVTTLLAQKLDGLSLPVPSDVDRSPTTKLLQGGIVVGLSSNASEIWSDTDSDTYCEVFSYVQTRKKEHPRDTIRSG